MNNQDESKFSRNAIFTVFVSNLSSTKINPLNTSSCDNKFQLSMKIYNV